jgi:hypothetical protein
MCMYVCVQGVRKLLSNVPLFLDVFNCVSVEFIEEQRGEGKYVCVCVVFGCAHMRRVVAFHLSHRTEHGASRASESTPFFPSFLYCCRVFGVSARACECVLTLHASSLFHSTQRVLSRYAHEPTHSLVTFLLCRVRLLQHSGGEEILWTIWNSLSLSISLCASPLSPTSYLTLPLPSQVDIYHLLVHLFFFLELWFRLGK